MSGRSASRLVLASASPRRRDLLELLGLEVVVRPADVDESPRQGESPDALVARLALAKAGAVATGPSIRSPDDLVAGADTSSTGSPDDVVVGADTIVEIDGVVLGKPDDADDAVRMLRLLGGRTHRVLTGLAVSHDGRHASAVVTTEVTFVPLTDADVAWYVATGEPSDKAGAYAIQGAGGVFVERIAGSYHNVVGLPLAELASTCALLDIDLRSFAR